MEGIIKSIRNGARSYVVENGSAYLRNRRFIRAAACRIRKAEAVIKKQGTKEKETDEKKKRKKVSFKKMVHFE